MLLFSLNFKKLLGSNSLHMALTSVSPSSGGTAGGRLFGFPEHTLTTGTKMLDTFLLDPQVR